MGYMERYEEWLAKLPENDPMRGELLAIKDNEKEIKERFYREIEFGTAGLRGICAAGTNRMNTLTVGRERRSWQATGSRSICSRRFVRLLSCPSRSAASTLSAAST